RLSVQIPHPIRLWYAQPFPAFFRGRYLNMPLFQGRGLIGVTQHAELVDLQIQLGKSAPHRSAKPSGQRRQPPAHG
ncbi:MAG TPA: hypothetical protein VN642_13120, partial [Dongiaceae bacterium]|nr:hypothetical protein [Dongiaceae bacterium]